jgi:hypothetical protein
VAEARGGWAPARKIFSSLSLEILTPFRISLLIWPFLINLDNPTIIQLNPTNKV